MDCATIAPARRPDVPIRRAFQPIADLDANGPFAYAALARGPEGQPAGWGFERVDREHLETIVSHDRERGFTTAVDDFGAGSAGLDLIADVQPDLVELDMHVVRGIEDDPINRAILSGRIDVCGELGVPVIAEGGHTWPETRALRDLGVRRLQGFYVAKPALESLPELPAERLEGLARGTVRPRPFGGNALDGRPGSSGTRGSLSSHHLASRQGPAHASPRTARTPRKGRANHAAHHVSRHTSDRRAARATPRGIVACPVGGAPESFGEGPACLICASRPSAPWFSAWFSA